MTQFPWMTCLSRAGRAPLFSDGRSSFALPVEKFRPIGQSIDFEPGGWIPPSHIVCYRGHKLLQVYDSGVEKGGFDGAET